MNEPEYHLSHLAHLLKERNDKVFGLADMPFGYFAGKVVEEAVEIMSADLKIQKGFTPRDFKKTQAKLKPKLELSGVVYSKDFIDRITKADWKDTTSRNVIEHVWLDSVQKNIGEEAADNFLTLLLLCEKFKIDLFAEVKKKFNSVSDEMKCTQYKLD